MNSPTVFIGIDLGTHCGWAVLDEAGDRVASGVWDCSVRRGEGAAFCYARLARLLGELLDAYRGARVAYEEVRRHAGTDAAHVYGGIVAHLQRICEDRAIPYCPVPVGTVKKLATGKGNAGKPEMIEAAACEWSCEPERDDEVDALWIAECLRSGRA